MISNATDFRLFPCRLCDTYDGPNAGNIDAVMVEVARSRRTFNQSYLGSLQKVLDRFPVARHH